MRVSCIYIAREEIGGRRRNACIISKQRGADGYSNIMHLELPWHFRDKISSLVTSSQDDVLPGLFVSSATLVHQEIGASLV
jgi:hypothetical protein